MKRRLAESTKPNAFIFIFMFLVDPCGISSLELIWTILNHFFIIDLVHLLTQRFSSLFG